MNSEEYDLLIKRIRGYRWWFPILMKFYFDKGLGLTSYMKYIIYAAGFASLKTNFISGKFLVIFGISYVVFCLILGWAYVKYRLIDTENEILNLFNPFQRQVRSKLEIAESS